MSTPSSSPRTPAATAEGQTDDDPNLWLHRVATAAMVVVFPVPAGPMMASVIVPRPARFAAAATGRPRGWPLAVVLSTLATCPVTVSGPGAARGGGCPAQQVGLVIHGLPGGPGLALRWWSKTEVPPLATVAEAVSGSMERCSVRAMPWEQCSIDQLVSGH